MVHDVRCPQDVDVVADAMLPIEGEVHADETNHPGQRIANGKREWRGFEQVAIRHRVQQPEEDVGEELTESRPDIRHQFEDVVHIPAFAPALPELERDQQRVHRHGEYDRMHLHRIAPAADNRNDMGLPAEGSCRLPSTMIASARSRSARVCVAITFKRRRAVPTGTAGGRTGMAKRPRSWQYFVSATARSSLPTITGMIAVVVRPVSNPAARSPSRKKLTFSISAR